MPAARLRRRQCGRGGQRLRRRLANTVAQEIRDAGGQAVASVGDVADRTANPLIATAVDEFGRLDTLVNNAGFVRDRMLVSLSEQEWDSVVRVHLKGPLRHLASRRRVLACRGQSQPHPQARIINTLRRSLYGSVGQNNFSAAKAGIAELTIQSAAEMGAWHHRATRSPRRRTQMTVGRRCDGRADGRAHRRGSFDAMDPPTSPLVVWLGSAQSASVTGRVFEVEGAARSRCRDGWQRKASEAERAPLGCCRTRAGGGGTAGWGPVPMPVYGAR